MVGGFAPTAPVQPLGGYPKYHGLVEVEVTPLLPPLLFAYTEVFLLPQPGETRFKYVLVAIGQSAERPLGWPSVKKTMTFKAPAVVVVGNPGRNAEDHRLRMVSVTRLSDGVKFGGSFD